MSFLDLDEIDTIASKNPIFSRNTWNLFSYFDADHLDATAKSTKEKVVAYFSENGVDPSRIGRVMLLTLPRILGYVFNPVSFYYCFDTSGSPFCALAEVGNTFGEKKLYFIPSPASEDSFRLITPKHFYVSPFSSLDLDFDFKLRIPGDFLEIHVDDRNGDQRVLLSKISGRHSPFSATRLAWYAVKYPLLTLRVISLIHWHAFLLWLKRIPFHAKEAESNLQRDVLNPHRSITGKSA